MNQRIYLFEDAPKDDKQLLGGKGAGLATMTQLGIPVPQGFTITTEVCAQYSKNKELPEGLDAMIDEKIAELEKMSGKKFGDTNDPLLVSVRSGAPASMPGMMDTVLNLGLTDTTVEGIVRKTNDARFAYDAYRRFLNMFGNVVLGVAHEKFEERLRAAKERKGVASDTDLDADDWKAVVEEYKKVIDANTPQGFPQEPRKQLDASIRAVFRSWDNPRAIVYRRMNRIPSNWGTAVNVQLMVFGNMGNDSGTGVAFTRNPSTGEKKHYGEFLLNAQGEDVVAGIRTPEPLDRMAEIMPSIHKELTDLFDKLEGHYKDMQDIEFTIEKGKLFLLQTRNGKRTGQAAIRIAADIVQEGLATKEEALMKVDPEGLNHLLHPQIDASEKAEAIAKGLPGSPGAATGKAVFSPEEALNRTKEENENVILVRRETSPEDIEGMAVANAIVTQFGGMTSHAAVVCRGMGKPCVVGCNGIEVNHKEKKMTIGDLVISEGDEITVDGAKGEIYKGVLATTEPELSDDFRTVLGWADEVRRMGVRTNADTPEDSKVAREFGAEGIGLCRTEHMFFAPERIKMVRQMILADTDEARTEYIRKLLPFQQKDFEGIFEVMDGYGVTVRLLDPPLHEFLPHEEKEVEALAKEMGVAKDKLERKVRELGEVNPMLGHRGCRLSITYPELTKMQTEAIMRAAIACRKKGIEALPEIEVPLVGELQEYIYLENIIREVADAIIKEEGQEVPYRVGAMLEVPRAALTAAALASRAEFLSFGTNDLTQMTYGYSRDDINKFLPDYLDKGILEHDPFQALDQVGVGKLMKFAVKEGRGANKDIEFAICGEHGGEPTSVEFCHRIGLNYVSCSPYRVPIARLAAAVAVIREKQ